MGNQASCCTQNKEAVPSEFHFNSPTAGSKHQFPGMTTLQDNSTIPSSAVRRQINTDYSVTKTQQDISENSRALDPKKKKKLVRKKPPPLTDLGSLQDCSPTAQEPVQYQSSEKNDIENELASGSNEYTDRKKGPQYWDITEEDRNLSVRLSEKRSILRERANNVTYREEDLVETVLRDGARGIQSRKEVIEAGIVAQKSGEEEDDLDVQYEEDEADLISAEGKLNNHSIKSQYNNTYQATVQTIEKHYKVTQNDGLTEVFETPREEFEEISERANRPHQKERDAALQSNRQMGSKTNRSLYENGVVNYCQQPGYNGQGKVNAGDKRVQHTQEEEMRTVSTVYEDAVSYFGRREQTSRIAEDFKTMGNESARDVRRQALRSQESSPISARRQTDYQDTNKSIAKEESYSPNRVHERDFQETEGLNSAREKNREDAAKLLSGLYHTCQSVVPAEPLEMSPMRERSVVDGERDGPLRRSFCGDDRKMFVSEIIKNIQMKNAYSKDKGTPQKERPRENAWLNRGERESTNSNGRRESVQRDVQRLMESAFKPRNSIIENILRQSKDTNVSAMVERDNWRDELGKKSEYSHPFCPAEERSREINMESPQQEQREVHKKNGLDTPGFKNEGLLDKSWERYTLQERKDMLLTKRFMDVPVSGFENK